MRKLAKQDCPHVLIHNHDDWLNAYLNDKTNGTNKYRYRHPDIKEAIRKEASDKCVYCESKVGHNTPGDIEHILPSSKVEDKIFVWENLTLACTECNRRKSAYFDPKTPFLNPYVDDVEGKLVHYGPIVSWATGDTQAEISIKTLELNTYARKILIFRKIEKVEAVDNLLQRIKCETNNVLKLLLAKELDEMQKLDGEFSAMVKSIVSANS